MNIGQTSIITIVCTTYGSLPNPLCKAYNGATKVLSFSTVSTSSLGESASDQILIGDTICGFDGYLKQIVVAKDGNALDSKKFSIDPSDLLTIFSNLLELSTCSFY